MNGRYAGKKGIIIRSNYENSKDKKFPHCLVVGLSKSVKRVTKKSLKRVEDRVRKIESSKADAASVTAQLNKLKRLGVFIKTYNMSHLLATRYKVEEDFGINNNIEKLDRLEADIKEKQTQLHKSQEAKDADKAATEGVRKEIGEKKDTYKNTLREVKSSIGTELFNRFQKGFIKTRDNTEENEKIAHSEFLFKKLKF
jgi:hypothetical protein